MTSTKKSAKQNDPRGSSRAAQNRKIRREALREELKAREYLRQIGGIEQRLDPDAEDTYDRDDLPKVRERVGILFRLLDKCLPNLRPVDAPIQVPIDPTYTGQGINILKAVLAGNITPTEATSLMQALSSHVRVVETDELTERLKALEAAYEHQTARRSA